jgi:hypothetical protein
MSIGYELWKIKNAKTYREHFKNNQNEEIERLDLLERPIKTDFYKAMFINLEYQWWTRVLCKYGYHAKYYLWNYNPYGTKGCYFCDWIGE